MIHTTGQREAKFVELRAWAWDHPLLGRDGEQPTLDPAHIVILNNGGVRIGMTLNR